MSEELASMAQDAGELLRYAMDPHETPYQNKRYSELLNQLYTSPNFKLIFENMSHGLEIQILAYSPHGVFLAGRERSPFAFRMEDYRSSMKAEERVVHGVFLLAIAAYCFPNIEVLDQDDEVLRPRLSVDQVAAFVQDMCKVCKTNNPVDPEHGGAEIQLAWQIISGLPESALTAGGKLSLQSLAGIARYALDFLVENGLMRFINDDNRGTYQPSPGYRIQIRQLAGNHTLKLIQFLAREGSSKEIQNA